MIVNVIVIGTVIVAVHAHGNGTVIVIVNVIVIGTVIVAVHVHDHDRGHDHVRVLERTRAG